MLDWIDASAKPDARRNEVGPRAGASTRPQIYSNEEIPQSRDNKTSSSFEYKPAEYKPAALTLGDRYAALGGTQAAQKNDVAPLPAPGVSQTARNTINLNFENADIKAVTRAILGDVLNHNYTIDPRVTGTISLSTRRPVLREQLIPLLENALRAAGAVMVLENGTYRILSDKEAAGVGAANLGRDAGEEGYGVTALPLENISADALLKILEGFGAKTGSIRIDTARNLLIVRGTFAERQSLVDNALAFDVEWMRSQSVGIFPIENGNPDTVITELEKMVDPNLVKFQPIARMNAVLAISKNSKLIQQVATWIARLDRSNDLGTRVRVYRLRNADARRVAALVREVFGGAGGSGGQSLLGAGADQVAPGGGASISTRVAATGPSGATATRSSTTTVEARPDPNALAAPVEGGGSLSDLGGAGSRIRITADVSTNSVLVHASQQESKMIERTIRELDRAPVQVAIEATVAEITLNDALRNGVQFYLTSKDVKAGNDKGSFSMLNDILPLARVIPGLNLVLGRELGPKLILDVLREVTDVKVLSSPSLMVVDNQPAVLQVGDQVPITTRTAQAVIDAVAPIVNSIDFRDTGVILRVTPRVRANSMVSIEIEQELSAVKDSTSITGAPTPAPGGTTTLTPTISQRKVKSTVSISDGQTLLLAGLINEQRTVSKNGLPGVMDLPVLGNILTNHRDGNTRTELIIFIKPQIVRGTFDAQRVAEDLRRRLKGFERW